MACLGSVVVCSSLYMGGGRAMGEIHIHSKCNCNNVISVFRTDQRPIYKSGEAIIRMPYGIIARCVQFVEFTIALVRTVKMVRRKRDDKDSTGAPSKEKVKEVKKRPLRKKYDRNMLQKAVDKYRKGQHLVTKVTYTELEEKCGNLKMHPSI